ncbi:dihydrolipoamide dehydrogenase [Nitratiruptor sp. YY08-26]|uniref:dihydrolipoyl dehydrogenase family protein n=1 Tax=unclassified Nitratiruptor TaxID=2624044 RepID=UPI0019154BFB|nr:MULTISPECIES: NAD(P)/FAD-dependent oxidoreductase [unclassified Nitratiruptor]BCD62270.1 dihydrolipoamide dehydrogenase [Nitratiruptor sp. YY08-13]BCD66206.1 dihydrolipoamide dehydrogenase [Nitratiruptor sp. YY08-26]
MYDIIFIGGGLNYAGAVVAAKKGLKVALIEQDMEHIGGTCLNNGCIPSKHFLHLAETEVKLKNPAFIRHKDRLKLEVAVKEKDEVIHKAHRSIEAQCLNAGVELIEGKGYIFDNKKIEVNGKKLEAQYVVLGTGSSPFIPQGIAYNKSSIITSDEVLNLTNFPENIAIYGSGAIGLEMASFFAACGVQTTLIFRHEHISNKIHPTLLTSLEKELQKLGIQFLKNTTIIEATEHNKKAKITTNEGVLEFDKLLVATGRKPNTDVVKTDYIKVSRAIETDEYFATTMQGVYAIGDCNGKLQLAHAARAMVLNVVNTIMGKKKRLNLNNIPKFFYTLPLQYAAVGVTKTTLDKSDIHYKEEYFPLSALALSHLTDAANGGVVLYTDEENFILGAELLTPHAEELIGIITAALAGEMNKDALLKAVFAHPTFSESIDRVLRRVK